MFLCGCAVGPHYTRPSAPVPTAFKEAPPAGWKEAQPNDSALKGKWWEMFNDPALNALEEQVAINNQNVLMAEAQYREARDLVRVARSALFPTVTTGPAITAASGGLGTVGNAASSNVRGVFSLPVDASYTVDLWGSIRRTVHQEARFAQASAAQLENAKLTYQADLANDYFQLHGVDGDIDLLERTVASYKDFLQLTRNRYASGVASGGDIAQAETQLYSAQASLIDLQQARAIYEHAIAVLTGKPPAQLEVSHMALKNVPPQIPVAVPSALLERRPDVAAAERQMAAAHEQIGINQAAFYPTLSISAGGGFQSGSFVNWFTWPARFWSIGPSLAETLFDAGRRRAEVAEANDAFDAALANYRQTVLTGFQQVEDNLASLRVLENEASAEAQDVDAAERSLTISTAQYKAGTVSYLQVITSQALALSAERSAVDILTRRYVASVTLIEALGGGWNESQLPQENQVASGK